MKQEVKKLLILNLPYLLFVYLFDKIGAAIRLTPGADASEKLLQLGTGFAAAFSSTPPICLSALRGRSLSGLPFT